MSGNAFAIYMQVITIVLQMGNINDNLNIAHRLMKWAADILRCGGESVGKSGVDSTKILRKIDRNVVACRPVIG
jgi:hypothetical protein